MKNLGLMFFLLSIIVLIGAGCVGTSPMSTPETNTPTVNAPLVNEVIPTNESVSEPLVSAEQPAEEAPKTATVVIQDFSFNPPSVIIAAGGEVTWINRDSVNHTVTGEDWGSESFGKNQSFTKKFETPGGYPYYCTSHPNMTGRVIVE